MTPKPSKLQPALIGGLIIGVLSSIPLVAAGNLCCCLWVLLGGAVAARMLIKGSPYLPITTGEGAQVGALAGVVSSAVTLVIGVPLNLLLSGSNSGSLRQIAANVADPEAREFLLQAAGMMGDHGIFFALISWFVGAILFIGFATLGGMIGVAMFEKRKGQQPPMAPSGPDYGRPGQPPYGQGPTGY